MLVAGYTALHYAAAWGRIQCLKTLVELAADQQMRTAHGERAREIAERYGQTECVDFLDWAGEFYCHDLSMNVKKRVNVDNNFLRLILIPI